MLKASRSLERLISIGTLLVVAGCGSEEGSRSAEVEASEDSETVESGGLMGVEWHLVVLQIDGGAPMTPDAEAIPTITFLDEATPAGLMRFGGSGGCNRFNGEYDAGDDGSLSMSQDVAMTMMACPEAIMRLEQGLMMAFAEATSYEIDGDELSVTFGRGRIRFTASP